MLSCLFIWIVASSRARTTLSSSIAYIVLCLEDWSPDPSAIYTWYDVTSPRRLSLNGHLIVADSLNILFIWCYNQRLERLTRVKDPAKLRAGYWPRIRTPELSEERLISRSVSITTRGPNDGNDMRA